MVTERALELPSRIRSLLGERLGSRRADMWFDCASTVSVEGGKLAVEAESSYAADWIRKNFGGDLRAVSQEALGRDDFELRVKETPATNIIDAPGRCKILNIAPTITTVAPILKNAPIFFFIGGEFHQISNFDSGFSSAAADIQFIFNIQKTYSPL